MFMIDLFIRLFEKSYLGISESEVKTVWSTDIRMK